MEPHFTDLGSYGSIISIPEKSSLWNKYLHLWVLVKTFQNTITCSRPKYLTISICLELTTQKKEGSSWSCFENPKWGKWFVSESFRRIVIFTVWNIFYGHNWTSKIKETRNIKGNIFFILKFEGFDVVFVPLGIFFLSLQ